MVKIDVEMPARCCECPCFDKVAYGRCNVLRKFLDWDEGSKLAEKRPEWCPLEEVKSVKLSSTHRGKPFEEDYYCGSCGKNVQRSDVEYCPWCGGKVEKELKADGGDA